MSGGPVVVVAFQSPWAAECVCCGKAVAEADTIHERHESNGIAGYAPWCRRCYRKHVGPIPAEYRKGKGKR